MVKMVSYYRRMTWLGFDFHGNVTAHAFKNAINTV